MKVNKKQKTQDNKNYKLLIVQFVRVPYTLNCLFFD